jgi:hypothetical protein
MFMAIPSHAYLRLKIPGPAGVITVEAKTQRALNYEQDSIELAATMVTAAELWEINLWLPIAPLRSAMPPMSGIFKADEDARAVQVDVGNLDKAVQIGASLNPK